MEDFRNRLARLYQEVYNSNASAMAADMGISQPAARAYFETNSVPKVTPIISLLERRKDINPSWLMLGDGDMYRDSSNLTSGERTDVMEVEEVPVISQELARATNTDIVEYINENKDQVQFASLAKEFPDHDALFQVLTNSMDPYISKGDWLALKKIPSDVDIIEGEFYFIDANQGCLVRRLYKKEEGVYIAEASHPSYPPVILRRDEINNICFIAAVVKFSITPASLTLKDFHKLEQTINKLNEEHRILIEENRRQGERIDILLDMVAKSNKDSNVIK